STGVREFLPRATAATVVFATETIDCTRSFEWYTSCNARADHGVCMEGSSARGRRWPNRLISEERDALNYQSELVRIISSELTNTQVVFSRVDPGSNTLNLPAWLKAHLERHPALYKKLEQGELVGISHIDQAQTPRLVGAVRSSIL